MFETSSFLKLAQLDDFEHGCIGNYQKSVIDHHLQASTLAELQEKIYCLTMCKPENQELNACDEMGRIDAGTIENADGYQPTKRELDQWRNGELKLWYVVYTFYVESVTRIPATLN